MTGSRGGRRIVAARRVGQLMFERVLADCGHCSINNLPDKAAVRFHVHSITAGRWIGLGDLLRLVPKMLRAFLDGTLTEITYPEDMKSSGAHAECP
ncbi:hypothetical protein ACWDTI_19035 [Gordonia sp. NPDC003424]